MLLAEFFMNDIRKRSFKNKMIYYLIDCYGGDFMSGYQRFISYIYAYSPNGKERNVGFAKVEVRGEQKRIGISLKGIYGMDSLQVAVFWRSGSRVELLPFSTVSIHSGNAQAQYVLSNELFREYGRGLEGAAGIILSPEEEGRAYVTVWDEEEFRLEMMNMTIQEEAYIEEKQSFDNSSFQEERNQMNRQQAEPQENQQRELLNQTEQDPFGQQIGEQECGENCAIQRESDENDENQQKENVEQDTVQYQADEEKTDIEQSAEQGETTNMDENLAMEKNTKGECSKEEQQKQESEQRLQAQILHALFKQLKGEESQTIQDERGKEDFFSAAEVKEQNEEIKMAENEKLWDSLRKLYPQAKPFQAQESVECLKIKPGSIGRLPRQNWIFANNNFVLYGYMKYHYLVLIKMGENYFLGVPGKGDVNAKTVANQFGFERFYPVEGKRGYWCVEVMR